MFAWLSGSRICISEAAMDIEALSQLPPAVVETLQRILQNIVKDPASARYRTLPLDKPKIASLVLSSVALWFICCWFVRLNLHASWRQ